MSVAEDEGLMLSDHPAKPESGSDVSGVVKEDHAVYARQFLIDNNFADKWEVTLADDYHLLLDYDCANPLLMQTDAPVTFQRTLAILEEVQGDRCAYRVMQSKGGNTHVIITLLKPLPVVERVAWQAAFGSDPVREACHLKSLSWGELNPILLYTRKEPNVTA